MKLHKAIEPSQKALPAPNPSSVRFRTRKPGNLLKILNEKMQTTKPKQYQLF